MFDVGGTNLRTAVYSAASDLLVSAERRETPSVRTLPEAGAEQIRKQLFREMAAAANAALGDEDPTVVAVAFPGPIDCRGNVLAAPTVWGDRQGGAVQIRDRLASLWPKARILLLNDVCAAGYRYLNDPKEDLCIVTVSSGIGHKVFADGRAITGPNGRGGEIGHLRVDFSEQAPQCECGGFGHLGAVASGRATDFQVARLAAEDPEGFRHSSLGEEVGCDVDRVDNRLLVGAFRRCDAWAGRVIERMASPLARVLAAIHLTVGVERFVIIGGFALALGPGYRNKLCQAARECGWILGADWDSMIELGLADDDAGLIGAGRFAARQMTDGTP